jgi:hypothetical protein
MNSRQEAPLLTLLTRAFAIPRSTNRCAALLGMELPYTWERLAYPGELARLVQTSAWYVAPDEQRHYINLPFTARYTRAQHCPDGVCSRTLLEQRAIR